MRPLQPGLTLRSYRLEHLLGFGASGQVWLAKDTRGKQVALKARPRKGGGDEQRFRQEFEKLRTLRLPGVVRVLDTGADQGYIFFTMEVVRGEAFDVFVQAGDSLAQRVARAATAGAQVARALAAIHRLELAHRDIKPANVLVDEDQRATVLDFGTLRFGAGADTSSGFRGTVAYMAPEQRVGLPHDHRVDLYALGVTLHQSLSGEHPGRWKPGRPRPTLATQGPDLPMALAWLVDRMLSLDPAARPSAEECEAVLSAIADDTPLAAPPWPSPATYAGDPQQLLSSSAVVTGPPGTGRRRLVQEARWHWYRKGYRSVAGRCSADRPFGALRDILGELFAERSMELRRKLAGAQAPLLKALWPELPVPAGDSPELPPDPARAGQALAEVLNRLAPLAVVLWEADAADVGTARILPELVSALPDRVRLWATARQPLAGLRPMDPPPWDAAAERAVLADLLPPGTSLNGDTPSTPLQSCARAWRVLATWRGQSGPPTELPTGLARLAILDEPFPAAVARDLAPELDRLLADGHLVLREGSQRALRPVQPASAEGEDEVTETSGLFDRVQRPQKGQRLDPDQRLSFADRGTRRLARAAVRRPELAHLAAARAWERATAEPTRALHAASHALRAGRPTAGDLDAALRIHLNRGNPGEVHRWLQLRDLHLGASSTFLTDYARLYVDAELNPGRVRRGDIKALGRRARDEEQRGLAGYLLLKHDARTGDKARAIDRGRKWAAKLAARLPAIAAGMLREVALARLSEGDPQQAVEDCREALTLAREAARRDAPDIPADAGEADADVPLTQAEVNVATTLSAGLIYSGRLPESARFCKRMARRCKDAGIPRGEGAMLCNLAISRFHMGERQKATEAAVQCRAVQPRHRDPLVLAVCVNLQARLAVEIGDLSAGRPLLDEAMNAGQALQMNRLLAETWCLVLEASLQKLDTNEVRRALAAYGEEGVRSDLDHWPAVLGRWLWLRGDLQGALWAVDDDRTGHSGFLVEAERARLLLVSGRYDEARQAARDVHSRARQAEIHEVARFAQLVEGAARAAPDRDYAPLVQQTRNSRWVHLYLGALHLDAIRRRLRGEHVGPLLRQLRARSRDVGHRFYEILAREDAW